jgi:hypothetical protein
VPLRHTTKTDFNGDSSADLLWAHAPGTWAHWDMAAGGQMVVGASLFQTPPNPGYGFAALGDADGNGTIDVALQAYTGEVVLWTMSGGQVSQATPLTAFGQASPIVASGDFNGDGKDDFLLHSPPNPMGGEPDGAWTTWNMDNRLVPSAGLGHLEQLSVDWQFAGVGDFNGDGRDDLLFHGQGNATVGAYLVDLMNPAGVSGNLQTQELAFRDPQNGWSLASVADFDGDGKADLLWRHEGGTVGIWLMDGNQARDMAVVGNPGTDWKIANAEDYNGDGKADILWQHEGGSVGEWTMNGTALVEAHMTAAPNGWTVIGF